MHPFWSNIYDDVKDRRYGSLFFATCLIVCGLLLLAAALGANLNKGQQLEICLAMLPGVAIVTTVFVWRWIRYGRKRREERLKYATLSRDELFKARSKLKNQTKPVKFRAVERPPKRVVPRSPDTDLKY